MELHEQLHNVFMADFNDILREDENALFDLFNLMRKLEQFFEDKDVDMITKQ